MSFSTRYYLLCALFFSIPALAYIDPGMGGFLLQGMIAILLGFVFQFLKFLGITGNKPGTSTNENATPNEHSNKAA